MMKDKLVSDVYNMKGTEKQGAFKFVDKQTLEASPFYSTREGQTLASRIEEELALLSDGLHPVSDLQHAFDTTEGEGLYVILVDYFYPTHETHADFVQRIDNKYHTCNGIKINPYKKRIR